MTLKELSQHLGLSQTTVSRALNGYPEVSESTRTRVHEAALAHGYRPNMRARGLATGCSMNIAHVLPISTKHEMVNPIFSDFVAGASEVYARHGYSALLTISQDQDETQAYRNIARSGVADGFIVHGPSVCDPRIALLHELGVPFVVHGRSSEVALDYNWLDVNNRGAFRRATDFLLDLGHQRIGLLNGLRHMDFAMRRHDGYLAAHKARGIAIDPDLMRHEEMTEHYGYRAAREMLDQPGPPTAFLVSSLITGIGVRRAADEVGLRLGQDVSVVVFDDELSYFGSEGQVPAFTSVTSSVRTAGRMAAEMLLNVVKSRALSPQNRLLEATLTVGRSTGTAPG